MRPKLDEWLPQAAVRVRHARASTADPDRLWAAARAVRLSDTTLLGRVIRWRIPGVPAETTFDALLRSPPFAVLFEGETALLAGLVGRIWTLRRDYPLLEEPEQFRHWSQPGTARVLFGNWVERREHDDAARVGDARAGVRRAGTGRDRRGPPTRRRVPAADRQRGDRDRRRPGRARDRLSASKAPGAVQ